MGQHWRQRWLVVQGPEALLQPRRERHVDPVADAPVTRQSVFGYRGAIAAEYQGVHVSPTPRKCEPALMARIFIGKRLLDNLQKPVQPALQIGGRVRLDAGNRPRPGQPISVRMRNRFEETFQEQVVEVDA